MWEIKKKAFLPFQYVIQNLKCKNFLFFPSLHFLTLDMEVSMKKVTGDRAGAA